MKVRKQYYMQKKLFWSSDLTKYWKFGRHGTFAINDNVRIVGYASSSSSGAQIIPAYSPVRAKSAQYVPNRDAPGHATGRPR